MNTIAIIQSKQALEDNIKALVSAYLEEHNLSDISVNTRIRRYYAGTNIEEIQTNATVTVRDNGADIVIK